MAITVAALQAKMGYDDDEFTRGLDGSASKLSKFGGIAKAGMLAAGTAVAAGLAAVAASVITVQDAFTPLMTMTGKNTEQFKLMSEGAKEVIRSSPHSAAEIGSAAYEILGAGITDAAEAQATLVAANKLSLAGLGPISDSVDLITSAMNAWRSENITGDQAAKILFGTISVGKGTIADFSRGFGEIAPLASNLGVGFKELMAATATLTTTGLPASQAYSGLKAAFSNILNPTKEAAGVAESLGITMGAAGIKAKGLAGFIADVSEKSGGSTDALVSLFGSMDAVNAIMGLSGPNAEAFAKSFETIDAAGQGLDQTAKNVSETFSNRIKIMKNNTLLYLSEIGQKGLDWLADQWTAWGPKITGAVNDFKSELDGIGSPDGNFFQKLGDAAGKAWITVKEIFGEMKTGFNDFITGWSSGDADKPAGFFENLGSKANGAWEHLKTFFSDVKTGFDEFKKVLQGDGGRETDSGWIGAIQDFALIVRDTFPTIEQDFDNLKAKNQELRDAVDRNWGDIIDLTNGAIDAFRMFTQVSLWLTQSAVDGMAVAWRLITEVIVPGAVLAYKSIAWVIENVVLPAGRFLIDQLDSIGRFVVKIAFPWLIGQLDQIGRMVMAVVKPAFDFLIGQLDSIGRFVVGIVVPAFRWVVDQLDQIGRGAMAAARGILTALSWIGTNVTAAFVGIGTWLWNAGVSLITGLIGGIGSMARSAANAAIDVARGAVNGVKNFLGIGSPSKVFRQIGSNVGEGLVVGLDQSHNMVASAAAGMANAMLSASQYNYNIGGPGTVQVNMPQGSNGNDVVRALRDWQKINGRIPVAVTGRNV